ncbi:Membrane protein involved in the export of O-antigen and teichoic acid [Jatrophihabitans endophyticus]|uniref:Membrane protein involved in the export of O-antigen and teichoic acid n=1 Tax=Jatrophihabitans endophyticus TaxID=1206085 RepID=A0A1M5U7A8_9ACTN|nr:hypothetical protein [Jatrophihabitans endophyticus]SHH58932.1 Membrane protein involved in the export of O-antigen and teichoic acid [Jatrophihabitans endophyticus]
MSTTAVQSARAVAKRLGWGLADQALSSLSNFGVGIMVARVVSPREFGVFAVAFSIYSVMVGVVRAIGTDALVVRFSAADSDATRDASRRAGGTALWTGAAVGGVLVLVGVVIGGDFRWLLIALGATMPGLLLQEAWRNIFFASAEGRKSFVNDAVWTVLLVPAFVIANEVSDASASSLTFAWGLSACVAACFGAVQARLLPDPRLALAWLRENRTLWPRFLAETVLFTGTQQVYLFAIGLVSGLVAVGQLKLVQIALGPVNVVSQGIGLVAVPEAVRAMHRGLRRLDAVAVAISVLVGGGALAWGLILGLAPAAVTSGLVGTSWLAASSLLLPLSLYQIANGLNTGAFVGLRAFKAARRSLAVRVFASLAQLAGALVGVAVDGARGAAYGLFAASVVYLSVWWSGYLTERSRFGANEGSDAPARRHSADASSVT